MAYLSDIEIAQSCKMEHIMTIAQRAHVDAKYVEQYGNYKAKIDLSLLSETTRPDGKLILVTAITPTPAGEGKTTTTIGLADGLRRIGKDVTVALREPSLGPVFGIKGGAAGGGYAQVVPMEDINLHFTGDFHAIGAANNLLAAMLDNHIQQGNDYILAQLFKSVGQTYGSGGLAFTGRGGVDGGDQDQLAVGSGALFQQAIIHLCFVVAVKFQILRVNTGSFGDLGDGTHGSRLCDFDVGFEFHNFFLLSCVLK